MADFINTIDLLGDDVVTNQIVGRTLVEFKDDEITQIGTRAFSGCVLLENVDLPNVTLMSDYVFSNCKALKSVNLPNVPTIGTEVFYGCKLTIIDLPKATHLGSGAFSGCTELTRVILRSETLCSLSSTGVFYKTVFAEGGTGGTVYAPQALITEYQNATNWSTLYAAGTCNFVAIEGSEYE